VRGVVAEEVRGAGEVDVRRQAPPLHVVAKREETLRQAGEEQAPARVVLGEEVRRGAQVHLAPLTHSGGVEQSRVIAAEPDPDEQAVKTRPEETEGHHDPDQPRERAQQQGTSTLRA